MEVLIEGNPFRYVENALQDSVDRTGYFALAKEVFGLDFGPWFRSGYCTDSFCPYTLYDGGSAAASVGVVQSEMKWRGRIMRCAQISTVMTAPPYRGGKLNGWLMERVVGEWRNRCDLLYLYANDSVIQYYPRYGFEKVAEHTYTLPVSKRPGNFRRMDMTDPDDLALLAQKYKESNNPFSALTMENNLPQLMFHCITFLQDDIYYVRQYDAVVIAVQAGSAIFCYDIYTDTDCGLAKLIGVVAAEGTESATLGFTPRAVERCRCERSAEKDTTVFALPARENPLVTHKVTLPFLSRA